MTTGNLSVHIHDRERTRAFSRKVFNFIKKFKVQQYLNKQRINYREASGDKPQYILEKCPHCGSINHKGNFKAYKVYMNQITKKYCCYVCGKEGSLISLMSGIEKVPVPSILAKYIDKNVYEELPSQLISDLNNAFQAPEVKEKEPLKEMKLPDEFVEMFARPRNFGLASDYLRERGFFESYDIGAHPQKMGQSLDIRYCENWKMEREGKQPIFIRKRIIFPIWFDDMVVGWQGRDVTGNASLKYYISPGFEKARVLWRYDEIFEAEEITFCEGVFDGIKCWSHNPSCFFGKTLSEEQIALLQKMPNLKRIILALDPDTRIPDKHGNVSFDKVAKQLEAFWEVRTIDLGDYKDCGEASFKEMKEILDNSKPYKQKLVSALK